MAILVETNNALCTCAGLLCFMLQGISKLRSTLGIPGNRVNVI